MLLKEFKLIVLFCFLTNIAFSQEICDNRIDDDGDGLIDCFDPDCGGDTSCWTCVSEFYQIHSNSQIVALHPGTGSYTNIGTVSGASEINGAQFNHIDGHIYAPCVINGAHKLGRLNMDGSVVDTGLSLPGSIFYAGGITMDGIMYISNGSGVHTIDLKQQNLSVVSTGAAHPGVADLALDNNNGLFYGIKSGGKLAVFDPFTLSTTTYNLAGSITNESGAFGAAWSCSDGSFFAYNNNSGKIYTVNPNDLTATLVLNATGNLSINDGFNCLLALPPLESNCSNGIDDDGDGLIDCADPDCYSSNVCLVEICDNGIDDDGDGWIDCSDSECFSLAVCIEICDNGIDDNNNGLIDQDDPQCSTPSGVGGGLESNRRLSDKLAHRNYTIKKDLAQLVLDKEEGIVPFEHINKSSGSIASFIPTDHFGYYVAESAPIDLIDNTNAIEVAAADYYNGESRMASILGIYSQDGVYEHSKYICDRLDGSQLLDMSFTYLDGGHFITYELLNKSQQREFAISFSAYLENGKFYIENHWNLHKYKQEKDYYNFQIWSRSNYDLLELLKKVVGNLNDYAPIEAYNYSALPMVFVSSAKYNNGLLDLHLKNKNKSSQIVIDASIRTSETSELENKNYSYNLNGNSYEKISLDLGYLYDAGLSVQLDGESSDEIFIADGSWGVDTERPGLQVKSFTINSETRSKEADKYLIERDINIEAQVSDYVNIYRSLDAKFNAKDLTDFNTFSFTASGQGVMEITLVKKSIIDWSDQHRTSIDLTDLSKDYNLDVTKFLNNSGESIDMNDIDMIVFSLINNTSASTLKKVEIKNLRFEHSILSSTEELENVDQLGITPNPAKDITTISFDSNTSTMHIIRLYDTLGREVYTKSVEAIVGLNNIAIDISELNSGTYFTTIASGQGIAGNGKLIKK